MEACRLPTELLDEVLHEVEARTLWRQVRASHRVLRACAEAVVKTHLLMRFTVALDFEVEMARYDVPCTVTLGFTKMNRNPQYALFGEKLTFEPQGHRARAEEKWNRICAGGFGAAVEWTVRLDGRDEQLVHLPSLVHSRGGGVFVDWKEMLNAYFR